MYVHICVSIHVYVFHIAYIYLSHNGIQMTGRMKCQLPSSSFSKTVMLCVYTHEHTNSLDAVCLHTRENTCTHVCALALAYPPTFIDKLPRLDSDCMTNMSQSTRVHLTPTHLHVWAHVLMTIDNTPKTQTLSLEHVATRLP
jgi:hypothetical protein